MKRILFILALAAFCSCSSRLYNDTRSYSDSHFAKLQKIIDNPTTPANVRYSYTEASDLRLVGKMFYDTPNPYHRVDTLKYKGFTEHERHEAVVPSGVAVLFSTNSSSISIRTVYGKGYEGNNTMPVSYKGYDLYIKNKSGKWQWAGVWRPRLEGKDQERVLIKNMPEGEKQCMLYMPIYSEILSCRIGVEVGSYIRKLEPSYKGKILFHGSSYTHGISTSRAGMSYPMQFSRATGFEVLAFGMSGRCLMQDYFAAVIADVEADAYVFDAFSNPDYLTIKERLQPFIDKMIAAHPGKPLIFQQTIYRDGRCFNMVTDASEQAKQDMASSVMHALLKDPKYKDVYFIKTNADWDSTHEYSVDGTHPDDHGYYMWYKSIEKPILAILAKYGIK